MVTLWERISIDIVEMSQDRKPFESVEFILGLLGSKNQANDSVLSLLRLPGTEVFQLLELC